MQWLVGKKEPVFLKLNSNTESKIDSLEALRPVLNKKGQKLIDRDINFLFIIGHVLITNLGIY